MGEIYIRGIPEADLREVKKEAQRFRRSDSAQFRLIIEEWAKRQRGVKF